jgi:hypothetical protein
MRIGCGIGTQYSRVLASIDTQAQAHYDRVIADGGIMPAGLLGCNAWFVAVKAVYGVTDITTAISAGYDPHYLGAKIGAGSGTTLGQAATKLYSCSGASGDLVQATAASMPLLLVKNSTDANYWFGSGVAGNYCSTPNAAANQITGDIEIIALVKITNQSTTQTIIGKNVDGSNFSYWFGLTGANQLRLIFSPNGTLTITATSTVVQPFSTTDIGYVKVTKVSSTGVVKFFTSTDGVTYTQLGADVASTSGAMFNGNASVKLGAYDTANLYPFIGSIYRATISNSIGGTPVVDFNPSSYNAATSQTSWVSATSEVWTINMGTATAGYKGVLVDRTILQGDGVDDTMVTSTTLNLTTTSNITLFTAYRKVDSTDATYEILVHNGTSNFGAGATGYFVQAVANGAGKIFTRITRNGLNSDSDITDANYLLKMTLIKFVNNTNPASISNKVNNTTKASSNSFANTQGAFMDGVLRIFSNIGSSSFSNINLNTMILSFDTSDKDTAMYNAIKSFNNNAF